MRKLALLFVAAVSMAFASQARADVVFSSVNAPAGYVAFGAATGVIGVEDYIADLSALPGGNAQSTLILTSLRWVGGSAVANGPATFDFLKADGSTLVNSFNVTFANAGNFIYTITSPTNFTIDRDGQLRVTMTGGATGQWLINNNQNDITIGSSAGNPFGIPPNGALPRVFAFELIGISAVPEPATAGILVLGLFGLIAGSRVRNS